MAVDFSYCGHNSSALLPAWHDGGFRPCFLATVESLVLFIWAFIVCGLASVIPARRNFGHRALKSMTAYTLLACSIVAVVSLLAHVISVTVRDKRATEYVIVTDVLLIYSWLLSLLPIRRAVKAHQPIHLVTAIYAGLAVVFCSLDGVSYHSTTNPQQSLHDTLLLVIFCLRSAATLVYALFSWSVWIKQHCSFTCWGDSRPNRGYMLINDSFSDNHEEGTDMPSQSKLSSDKSLHDRAEQPTPTPAGTVHERSGTTFADFGQRLRLMWPFLWPKKKPILQLRVLICLVLLALGRVVNLYVPVSYKVIVDRLTPTSSSEQTLGQWLLHSTNNMTFPVYPILIYVGLRFLSGGGSGGMGLLNNIR